MFGFIRNAISRAATALLWHAVQTSGFRWRLVQPMLRPLLWLGADCNATQETHDLGYGKRSRETILTYSIRNKPKFALWLLSFPAIQQQVKNDETNVALFYVAVQIVDDITFNIIFHHRVSVSTFNRIADNRKNYAAIEEKLLRIKPISANIVAQIIKEYYSWHSNAIDTDAILLIIRLANEAKALHQDNTVLNTAIKEQDYFLVKNILQYPAALQQFNAATQTNGNAMVRVKEYMKQAELLDENVDQSGVINMLADGLGMLRQNEIINQIKQRDSNRILHAQSLYVQEQNQNGYLTPTSKREATEVKEIVKQAYSSLQNN